MRTLQVSYTYFPDPSGGTEVYVATLCRSLARHGISCTVAAPSAVDGVGEVDGVRVRRFAANLGESAIETLYGDGDPVAEESFDRVLDDERPSVVHQHALSPACSVRLLRAAKRRGLPTVFTYHTPAVSCQRGTMLRWGRTQCDGRIEVAACAACTLEGLGVARPLAQLLGRVPPSAGVWASRLEGSGRRALAFKMTSLMALRRARFGELIDLADRIVVLTPWVRHVLERNGARPGQLVDSPHGVAAAGRPRAERRSGGDRLRIAHLGRLDATKGTAVLLEAMAATPDAPIDLWIFGIEQQAGEAAAVERLASRDLRVTLGPALLPGDVVTTLADFDLVAVPSQIIETGPLVVLEAFSAGVPVVASRLGNLEHLVDDGGNGYLVRDFADPIAWARALSRLAADRALVSRMTQSVRPPRGADAVAGDMLAIYEQLAVRGRSERTDARRPA